MSKTTDELLKASVRRQATLERRARYWKKRATYLKALVEGYERELGIRGSEGGA